MNKSKKPLIYLAGAMETAKNLGASWRSQITPFLEQRCYEVWNPCLHEPEFNHKLPQGVDRWFQLKNMAHSPEYYMIFKKHMQKIIKHDLDVLVNQVDYVLVHWEKCTKYGAGTHAELTYAFMNDIPVLCVTKEELPAWIEACITYKFHTFKQFKNDVERGFIPLLK